MKSIECGQKQAFLASIGRNVGDADGVGVGDFCEGSAAHRGAVGEHAELFGLGANGAVKAHHEVFLPMPDEAADPEDFSAMQLEIDVNRAPGAKAFRLEDESSPTRARRMAETGSGGRGRPSGGRGRRDQGPAKGRSAVTDPSFRTVT